jgi:release factor glutamine methyltransferase
MLPAASAAGVRVLHDDAHVAVVWKPSGVALSRRDAGGVGPQRSGPPLEVWASRRDSALAASREADALPACRAVSRLERAVGGVVALAKTARAADALAAGERDTLCAYVAVVEARGAAAAEALRLPSSVQLLQRAAPPGRLSLVRVSADGAQRPLAQLCASLLRDSGLAVLGAHTTASSGAGDDRDSAASGAHIALVSLALPPSLAALRGADAPTCFTVDTPAKFGKAMKREALHAARAADLANADADADAAAGDGSTAPAALVSFCGVALRVSSEQLRPRPSSEPVVRAGVAAAARHAAPRVLDLGCGTGALLLAALAALPADATGVGVDIDAPALALALENAHAAGCGARVALLRADFGQLHAPRVRAALHASGYHALLCNPPYLRAAAGATRVTRERPAALYGGADGLRAYHALACSLRAAAPPLLAPGGVLVLQLPGSGGDGARDRVAALFGANGFAVAGEERDARGVCRALLLQQDAQPPRADTGGQPR